MKLNIEFNVGNIYFDKHSNVYVCVVSWVKDGQKEHKKLSAKSQDILDVKVKAFIDSVNEYTVESWINYWLDTFCKPMISANAYKIYKEKTTYVVSLLGKVKLKELTPVRIQEMLNYLFEEGGAQHQGLSANTVNSVRKYFKQALKSAVDNGILFVNPVNSTRNMKDVDKEIVVLDEVQVKRLLSVAKQGEYIYNGIADHRELTVNDGTKYYVKSYYNLINVAFATGMRIGELRGLQWGDIDFQRNAISIVRQVVELNGSGSQIGPLKTKHSKRKLSVSKSVIDELNEFKEYQQKYSVMLGDMYNNSQGFVFTNTFGGTMNTGNFRKRYFSKMLAEAKIPEGFTIHCTRHTHATLLLKNGENIAVVSRRLGHSSITVTYNIYTHLVEEMELSASGTWENILKD